jgi:hypothetical protein
VQVELVELSLQNDSVCGGPDALDDGRLDAVLESVMTLLTHTSRDVRRLARRRVSLFLRNNAKQAVRLRFIDAFYALLKRRGAEVAADAPASGDGSGGRVKHAESSVLAEAFAAIAVVDGAQEIGPLAARLLLPAHHPLLGRLDCWKKAVSSTLPQRAVVGGDENASEWCADDAADALVEAVREGMTSDLESACRAARTLARRFDTDATVDALASTVLDDLGDHTLRAVTAHEVDVYNTPEGTLSSEHNKEDDEIAALNPNSKDYEEQVWEIKVRRERRHSKTKCSCL